MKLVQLALYLKRRVRQFHFVEFALAIGCPLNCSYCSQETIKSAYHGDKMMELSTFKRTLNSIPKSKEIRFSGTCEPFKNPDCMKMIRYAFSQGYKVSLFTTGLYVTQEIIDELMTMRFNRFVIHIPDEHMVVHADYDIVTQLLTHPNAEPNQVGIDTKKHSRLGLVEDVCTPNRSGRLYCDINFDAPMVLPDGSAVICCMDWELKTRRDFIDYDYFERYGKMAMRGEDVICRRCEWSIPF